MSWLAHDVVLDFEEALKNPFLRRFVMEAMISANVIWLNLERKLPKKMPRHCIEAKAELKGFQN